MIDAAAAERALEKIRELEIIVGRLENVKGQVGGFDIYKLEDAGSALWAGEKRNQFTSQFDMATASFQKVMGEIDQAISDVKSRQRNLAWSINGFEHPVIAAQAHAIAF